MIFMKTFSIQRKIYTNYCKMQMQIFLYVLFSLLFLFPIFAYSACIVGIQDNLVFEEYDPLIDGVGVFGSGLLKVSCSDESLYSYKISLSEGYSGNYNNRTMRLVNGSSVLRYNLFIDVSRHLIWGNGVGTSEVSVINAQCNQENACLHNVYGYVYPNQYLAQYGDYIDNVIVALSY